MSNKQLSIPGLPVPKLKVKKSSTEERLVSLESRILTLELELSFLKNLRDYAKKQRDKEHA